MFTYFDAAVFPREEANNRLMLDVWKTAWRAAGFEPRIISEADARKHPAFAALKQKYAELPTINPKVYEVACFVRYLAMSVHGGGLMTDYDVLPLAAAPAEGLLNDGNFTSAGLQVPAYASASASEWDRVARMIADLPWREHPDIFRERGKPHVSDMHRLRLLIRQRRIQAIDSVVGARHLGELCKLKHASSGLHRCYTRVSAHAIHFSHADCDALRNAHDAAHGLNGLPAGVGDAIGTYNPGTGRRAPVMRAALPLLREIALHPSPSCIEGGA